MMKLRQMAAAFLHNGADILLMKRAETRELAPGLWAPVGGHLEPAELNDPAAACLREIEEETGIGPAAVRNFQLRYIISRLRKDEIRLQFIFFGETTTRALQPTIEGELHWIGREQVAALAMATTSRCLWEHYCSTGRHTAVVYNATMGEADGNPVARWAELQDWER